jgi:hypothetical protein
MECRTSTEIWTARDTDDDNVATRGFCGRDAYNEARGRDDAVVSTQYRGTEPPDVFGAVLFLVTQMSSLQLVGAMCR